MHFGDEFPDNSASAILRGDAYLADKQWTKAEQAYADALRTEVECAGTETIPRDCLLGDADGAGAILQDWMRDNPSDAVIRLTLASLAPKAVRGYRYRIRKGAGGRTEERHGLE